MKTADGQGAAKPIRLLPDGSIDFDHYRAQAEQLRSAELARWLRAAWRRLSGRDAEVSGRRR